MSSQNPRVVSLIASSTEIVCALGFADLLVARSHECDYPEFVKTLPQVTEPKMRTDIPSAEIDRTVKDIVRAGLSVYKVDAERLREMDPDIIITQDHCEVCAVSSKDLEDAVCNWLDPHVRVVSLQPDSLEHIWQDIMRVAEALGAPERGVQLVARLESRMENTSRRAREITERPRVAFIEWIDPIMAGGNWVPEMIAMLNAEDALGKPGEHSGWITFEDLKDADADVIVVSPCGFDLERTAAEIAPLVNHCDWDALRAVRNGRVYLADGNAYFNRPGPRVVESFEILAEAIHPEVFSFAEHAHACRRLT
jgi:iron complex transport system substrate-binding protein